MVNLSFSRTILSLTLIILQFFIISHNFGLEGKKLSKYISSEVDLSEKSLSLKNYPYRVKYVESLSPGDKHG